MKDKAERCMTRKGFLRLAATIWMLVSLLVSCTMTETNDVEQHLSHPYPRLGMWWLDPYEASIEEMARYDLLLDSFDDEYLQERFAEVKELNPDQRVLKPLSPTERQLFLYDWEEEVYKPNPEVTQLSAAYFLLQTGTVLTESIDEEDTIIFVKELYDKNGQPLFHERGEVAIGEGESARVIEIHWDDKSLLVERGYIRSSQDHEQGEHIASHIRFWPGSWVMNVANPEYIHYYFELITGKKDGIYSDLGDNYDRLAEIDLYNGIVIDRFEDKESWLRWVNEPDEIELDLYQNNTAVDAETFDASWEAGTTLLYTLLKEAYPDLTIIRNNPLTLRYEPFDGQVYESFGWSDPTTSWWENLVIRHEEDEYYTGFAYLEWWKEGASLEYEPLVLFEVYEDEGGPDPDEELGYVNPYAKPGFEPNYQRMRFSLASALLGDGYYSYEINTEGHGSLGLMWFDEYDNAGEGKGYLGFPTEKAKKLSSGAYQRKFEHGVVLVNPTDQVIQIPLDRTYQKIKGSQQPLINTGEIVDEVLLPAFDGIILIEASGY